MRRVENPTIFMCQLSRNSGSLNLLEPQRPVQTCNGIALIKTLCFAEFIDPLLQATIMSPTQIGATGKVAANGRSPKANNLPVHITSSESYRTVIILRHTLDVPHDVTHEDSGQERKTS